MLTKKVNGKTVKCSLSEETAILAQWADNDRPRTPKEIDTALTAEADIELRFNSTLLAFALTVLSEINILRVANGLPERTVKQLKDAVKIRL